MSVKWTENQLKAINSSGNNILVSAAAGSGKTAVLVERVIKLITDKDNPVSLDRLLMVTFTNAAAAEMKTRIYKAITKCIAEDPDNAVLHNQLSLLGQAQITTIHAFCQNMLRDNFYSAGVSPDFSIIDNVVENELKATAVEQAIEEAYELYPEETEQLMTAYGGRFDDSRLKNLILALYKFIQCQPQPEKWLDDVCRLYSGDFADTCWAKYLIQSAAADIKEMLLRYDEALKLSENGNADTYLSFLSSERELMRYVYTQLDGEWEGAYSAINKMVFETMPRKSKDSDSECAAMAKAIRDSIKKNYKEIAKCFSAPNDVITDELKNQYGLIDCLRKMTVRFGELYSEAKSEKNSLDFDDLLHITLDKLLSDENNVKELKNRFDEILVDEYQDTNAVNIAIFEKLSNGKNLFMVGDVKQSIYGFLNARPESFTERYKSYSFDGNELGMKIPLSNNFRSADNVLCFINRLFERIMCEESAGIDYTDDQKLIYSNALIDTSIPVEVHLLETKDDEGEYPDGDKLGNEAFFTAKRILSLVEVEKPLVYDDKLKASRPVTYSDIAILARSVKSDTAMEFTRQLALMGIPVTCEETGSYLMTIEISTVISFLKIIDNPFQDIPMLAVMRSPMFSFTENELAQIKASNPTLPFYKAVFASESDKVKVFVNMLDELTEYAKTESLELLIERIITVTGYYSFVGMLPDGKQRMANLKLLGRRANMFEQGGHKSIFEYITYINAMLAGDSEYKTAKVLSENENAVKIMTIHKSRGLEFPFVFVVQCGKRFAFRNNMSDIPAVFDADYGIGFDYFDDAKMIKYPSMPKLAIKKHKLHKELAEEIRVLYVALTRAKNFLCIIGSVDDAEGKLEKWSNSVKTLSSVINAGSMLEWVVFAASDTGVVKTHTIKDVLSNNLIVSGKTDAVKPTSKITYEEIDRKLSYTYKYKASVRIPSKVSVSELVHSGISPRLEKISEGSDKITVTKRGTIVHFVMQNINISKTTKEEIVKQVEHMVLRGMITENESKCVDIKAIADFFASPVGIRLKESKRVLREYSFCTELEADKVLGVGDTNEKVLVQGAVDCFFEEDDGLVVIDYKTGSMEEFYKKQISLYSMCLETIFGKPIKDAIIVNLV